MSEWIDAKKTKPKKCDIVLVLLVDGSYALAGYQKNDDYKGWFDDFDDELEVVYWMPIPELPKVDK